MPSKSSANAPTTVDATVTSKGQITLPKALRQHLGIDAGSKIRFTLHPGGFQARRVQYNLEDLWEMADSGVRSKGTMTFAQMNEAKARRKW